MPMGEEWRPGLLEVYSKKGIIQIVSYDELHNRFYVQSVSGRSNKVDTIQIARDIRLARVIGFHYASPETIYVLADDRERILLLDENGMLKKTWVINQILPDGDSAYSLFANNWTVPIIEKGNRLYIQKSTQMYDLRTPASRKLNLRYNTDVELDLISGKVLSPHSPVILPAAAQAGEDYLDNGARRIILPTGHAVRAYSYLDSVHEYDDEQKQVAAFATPSPYFHPNEPVAEGKTFDFAYQKDYLLSQSNFAGIFVDPYRRLYYRMLWHSTPALDPATGTRNSFLDLQWSVLIFDEQWRKRGEVVFPPRQYDPRTIHVTKDGLLVGRQSGQGGDNPPPREWELFRLAPSRETVTALGGKPAPPPGPAVSMTDRPPLPPPTRVFGAYLRASFGRRIPAEPHTWLLAPSGACTACKIETLLFAARQAGKAHVTLVTTPLALHRLEPATAAQLRAASNVLIDSTGRLDRLALETVGTAILTTENGAVRHVQPLTGDNAADVLRRVAPGH